MQDVHPDGHICLNNLRVLPSVPAAGCDCLALFKRRQLPAPDAAAATAGAVQQRNTRAGGAARGGGPVSASGLPYVRAEDVYLAAHVEGMPQQVGN